MKTAWGLSTHIDLHYCDPALIKCKAVIFDFALALCNFIEMERYGDPQIVMFGEDPRVAGFTLVQLLTTSSLTAHFAPGDHNSAYIDVFSCGDYDAQEVADFCKDFFQARVCNMKEIKRG